MPALELTDEQIEDLVMRLAPEKQDAVLKRLMTQRWSRWTELSHYGQERARKVAAERGCDWDAMSEEQREQFVDELLHEQ